MQEKSPSVKLKRNGPVHTCYPIFVLCSGSQDVLSLISCFFSVGTFFFCSPNEPINFIRIREKRLNSGAVESHLFQSLLTIEPQTCDIANIMRRIRWGKKMAPFADRCFSELSLWGLRWLNVKSAIKAQWMRISPGMTGE